MNPRKSAARVDLVVTVRTEPSPAQVGGSSPPALNEEGSHVYVTPEERVARLEADFSRLSERLAELALWVGQHKHDVSSVSVGLLRERINGRPVDLAISPKGTTRRTGPPVVET